VVHAHPPKAVGFTLAGIGLDRLLLPEVVFALGRIPTARYATPATLEGGEAIRELIRECDALLLDRHGAVTVGSGVMDAYFKMEKIEHAAESILTAHLLGAPQELTSDEMTRILAAREAYGAHGKLFL
jgi:L-fuculose-phosphate aldolase